MAQGFVYPKYTQATPIPYFGSSVATATAASAVVTLPAQGDGLGNVIQGVIVSYVGTVSTGNLQIQDGSEVILNIDLGAGTFYIPFQQPILGTSNAPMVITLASGGSGVAGKLTVLGCDVQPAQFGGFGEMDFSYDTNSDLIPVVL